MDVLPVAAAETAAPPAPQVRRDSFSWLREMADEAAAQLEQEEAKTPRQMFLPGFNIGAFPNHLNRSSFIAPIARGARERHEQAVMVTRRDCVLQYTGAQLDEADGDLIMALIAFAQPYSLGTHVSLNRKKLLGKIKTGCIGGTQYDWLHKSMKRLREGTLFLEARKPDGSTRYTVGKMESFNILKSLSYANDSETYTYALDPRWVEMFGNREYSLIDWNKRMRIGRGKDMAKTLQRLLATSADRIQRYALDGPTGLKAKMVYASPMRKFRESLEIACKELERVEIIGLWQIKNSTRGSPQLVLWR